MTTHIQVSRADDLGPALREARLSGGWTQAALARLAQVGRQWLNSFENGEKKSAPLDMVMRVVAALDVTVELSRPPLPAATTAQEPTDAFDLDEHLSEYDR